MNSGLGIRFFGISLVVGLGVLIGPAACGDSCPDGFGLCSGECKDITVDASNCGACGAVCPAGAVCQAGACVVSCPSGTTDCGQGCVATSNDPSHCGGCSQPCSEGEVCQAGSCGLVCLGGTTDCGGACVDTESSTAHCGGCSQPCDAGEICSGGQCELVCAGGTEACGGSCVDTDNDPAHCGGCNEPCDAGLVCQAGECALECVGGTEECDGACVDTDNDPLHCGGCTPCANPDHGCVGGECLLECVGGTEECGGVCVNTASDPAHCGGCDQPCGPVQACVDGDCHLANFIRRWSDGTEQWPDQACNPTNSFGGCNTNAVEHANEWADFVCQQNGWTGGTWTGNKIAGCSGEVSMFCWTIPCTPDWEYTCDPGDQTRIELICYDLALTKTSEGTTEWPDQACNPTNSFGTCDTNAVDHAFAWCSYVCEQNGYNGGFWTGTKTAGCAGDTSMYCGGSIPCAPNWETSCEPTDQTQIELTCF